MRDRSLRLFGWLYPGIGVKRWLVVAIIGALLLVNGISRWLVAEGMHLNINEWLDDFVDDLFPPSYLSWIFIFLGVVLIVFGIRQWMRSLLRASTVGGADRIVDTLLEMRMKDGYKIVAIGGGTGLSTLLRGLKRYTPNLTAVVTVSDDGGSSGPPAKRARCLAAGRHSQLPRGACR